MKDLEQNRGSLSEKVANGAKKARHFANHVNKWKLATAGSLAILVGSVLASHPAGADNMAAAPAWGDGKYQTFPELVLGSTNELILQNIDLGTLGPDVDTISGLDFPGDIPTGVPPTFMPADGLVSETRVVFLKRADLETVQMNRALRGDRFDVFRIKSNKDLDDLGALHAQNTARKHQKVIYLHDLGLFEKQYGAQEMPLLNTIIRAQRPGRPDLGIPDPDFVNPRTY